MASSARQFSMAAGEISPSMRARPDQVRYATGLKTCRNFLVKQSGGVDSRPGTEFICEAGLQPSFGTFPRSRLIPFEFNADQTYALEFGGLYMRVIKNGQLIKMTAQAITAITNANPCVVTYSGADTYANGDEVYLSGIVGDIGKFLNGRSFRINNVNAGANTFELRYMDNVTSVNSTAFGSYTSGGQVEEVFRLVTPYTLSHVFDLQFVQIADTMILTHPLFEVRTLTRTAHNAWTLAIKDMDQLTRGAFSSIAAGAAGANEYRYRVCAVTETGEEIQPIIQRSSTITAITNASPPSVTTSAAHNLTTGDEVLIFGVSGMVDPTSGGDSSLNFRRFKITVTGGTTFTIDGIDTTTWSAYSSGGTTWQEYFVIRSAAAPTSANPIPLSFQLPAGAVSCNVYRSDGDGIYGFIGSMIENAGTSTISFNDVGATPDLSISNPMATYQFESKEGEGYPAACGLYQQRLLLGGLQSDPEAVYASKPGSLFAFAPSPNLEDDSPIGFKMFGRQVNQIRYFVDLGELVIFTDGGEWVAHGGADGIIKPTQVNAKQHTYNGSLGFLPGTQTETTLPPIVADGSLLYVQGTGPIVRDFSFDINIDGYRGTNLTTFSAHLLRNKAIKSWAYQKYPDSVIWQALDDGSMLGLTYVREHGIVGWHRHDTDGVIDNLISIKEGGVDVVYMAVRRVINGVALGTIERMASRFIDDMKEAILTDSTISYDGRNSSGTSMTITGGTTWDAGESLTLQASASYFTASMVGKFIDVVGPTDTIRCEITGFTSDTEVTIQVNHLVPVDMRTVAFTEWGLCATTLQGYWHLEGKSLSVLGDGGVVANPNNSAYGLVTVDDGEITIPSPKVVIRAGLPFTCDLQTLPIDTAEGATLMNKKKLINQVSVFLESSRGGLWACASRSSETLPADDDLTSYADLQSFSDEEPGSLPDLITDPVTVEIESEWTETGCILIRQSDPLPLTVLSIVPSGFIPAGA